MSTTESTSKSLLPSNSGIFEKALEKAMTSVVDKRKIDVENFWDVRKCPAQILPFIAFGLGVKFWSDDWSLEDKRKVIFEYMSIRRFRGTYWALKQALEVFGVTVDLKEWWDDEKWVGVVDKERLERKKDPYFVEINILMKDNSALAKVDKYELIRSIIESVKPLRVHYKLNIILSKEEKMGLKSMFKITKIVRIKGKAIV